jgi:hypothetical protein
MTQENTVTLDAPVRPSTFARFCTNNGICGDRDRFHEFALSREPREEWTLDGLLDLWLEYNKWGRQAMIDAEDAADLQDTQACAVR